MDKLVMTDYLFHGFRPYRFDYNEINILGYDNIIIRDSSKMLKEVLDTGYILPRCDLKKFLPDNDYKTLKRNKSANWNGRNRVSICEHIGKTTNLYDRVYNESIHDIFMDDEFAFNLYIVQYPSLILDSKLLNELKVCLNPERVMIGEIQIEEKIPIDYVVGVALPNVKLIKDLPDIIRTIVFSKKCTNINNRLMADDLINMNEEDFVKKYYYNVIRFEQILRVTNSNLKLYNTLTGVQVISSSDMVDCVKQIKKKYL